jgi:hypothetical protein
LKCAQIFKGKVQHRRTGEKSEHGLKRMRNERKEKVKKQGRNKRRVV